MSKIFIFTFLILNFIGCAAISKDKPVTSPTLLEPQALLKFADLPVPVGFKLLTNESYSFESSGIRVAVLKYQGKADVDRVINFYKEQMPIYNWSLLNIVEYGQRLLNFDRETETCIVSLLPKGSTVFITITLGPKSQITKKSSKPVK